VDSSVYSEIILELYKNPPNYGKLEGNNFRANGGIPSCGDVVSFEAKIGNGKISDVRFTSHGCAISKAGAALLTELVKGKTISEAKGFSSKDIFEHMGSVLQTRTKCALLGLEVFKTGLMEFEKKKPAK